MIYAIDYFDCAGNKLTTNFQKKYKNFMWKDILIVKIVFDIWK